MDLDELKRLLEVATPAPWDIGSIYQHQAFNKDGRAMTFISEGIARPDTQLICALRNAAPQLIQELEELQEMIVEVVDHGILYPRNKFGLRRYEEVAAKARSRVEEIRRKK